VQIFGAGFLNVCVTPIRKR